MVTRIYWLGILMGLWGMISPSTLAYGAKVGDITFEEHELHWLIEVLNTQRESEIRKGTSLSGEVISKVLDYRHGKDGFNDKKIGEVKALTDDILAGNVADFAEVLAYARAKGGKDTEDPFDPRYCTGPALAESTARSWIGVPKKIDHLIGHYELKVRVRECYPKDGCNDWYDPVNTTAADVSVAPAALNQANALVVDYPRQKQGLPAAAQQGDIRLALVDNWATLVLRSGHFKAMTSKFAAETRQRFTSDESFTQYIAHGQYVSAPERESELRFRVALSKQAKVSTENYMFVRACEASEYPCTDDGLRGSVLFPRRTLRFDSTVITEQCMRAHADWKYQHRDTQRNDRYYQYQAVAYGKVAPKVEEKVTTVLQP